MRTTVIFAAAVVAAACLAPVEAPADPVATSESPTSAAMGPERSVPRESVVAGTIAWSNRRGTELTMGDGTQLTVPLTVKGVVHTDLKPRRPIEAFCERENGRNVVTLMFVQGVHPGGGG